MCTPTFEFDPHIAAIKGFHVHIYFDEKSGSESAAKSLAHQMRSAFKDNVIDISRVGVVGPHLMANYEVDIEKNRFGDMVMWLMVNNRRGLSILVHPETGSVESDHIESALWLGKPLGVNTEFFEKRRTGAKRPGLMS